MTKRKYVFMGAIAGSLFIAQSVFAAGIAATPSENALSVKTGDSIEKINAVPAYLYQDNNYFMLRDIGKVVGYEVKWNESTKTISMMSDKAAQNYKDMSKAKQAKTVAKSKETLLIDGKEYADKECLNIDGYNYFKLRDMAEIMNFTCGWDDKEKSILLTINKEVPETELSVDRFLDPDLDQKVIEDNVVYRAGSKDYKEIEAYIQKNIDKKFDIKGYIVTEDNSDGLLSGYNQLIMKLDVNGVSANFGYIVTCLNDKAAIITFIGEKNPDFSVDQVKTDRISDEEAKKKAIEADGYDYEVDEQRIRHFFDMKDLKNKCEVETVYIDNSGHYFATSHIFE